MQHGHTALEFTDVTLCLAGACGGDGSGGDEKDSEFGVHDDLGANSEELMGLV